MKKVLTVATVALTLFLLLFSILMAAPDPRDSVIVQTKLISPGQGHPYTLLRVWITNKDSISNYNICLIERSVSHGAYVTLGWPRNFDSVIVPLTSTLRFLTFLASNRYNSVSPDSFIISGYWDPTDTWGTAEPPNATRKALLDIKFDTAFAEGTGTVEFGTGKILDIVTSFQNKGPHPDYVVMEANFKKGIVTVYVPPPPPDLRPVSTGWDLNYDKVVDVADVVLMLQCVYVDNGNCRGSFTPGDVVALLRWVYGVEAALEEKR